MNTVTAVRMALVLFLLCSGLFHTTFATQRLRLFGDAPTKDTRVSGTKTEASKLCEKNDTSLVTVYDEEDAEFLYKFTADAPTFSDSPIRRVWLGLHHVGNYTWSNGEPVIFNQTSETLKKGEQKCEAIHHDTWQSFNCSEKKSFMCFKDNKYTLHSANKTWCQALHHCRMTHSELVSINSTEQNEEVIKEGNGASFWIGLRHDEWKWDDDGCSSFREWQWSEEVGTERFCTMISAKVNSTELRLYDYICGSFEKVFCVAGHVRIKVINENRRWEEALEYCVEHHSRLLWIQDEKDRDAVEQWLNHTDASGPFWIGLRQSRMFGFWIWSDSMVVYSNWKNEEEPELSMYNLCGIIDKTNNKWSERDCRERLPFLCEEDIIYT